MSEKRVPITKIIIVVVCVILLFCNGCTVVKHDTGPIVKDMLNDMPCAIPCWQGITPGQTTEQAAMDILSSMAYKSYISDPWHTSFTARGASSLSRGNEASELVTETEETRISWLPFNTDEPHGMSIQSTLTIVKEKVHHIAMALDTGLTAKMVLAKWGEPERVFVMQDDDKHHPHIWATLCYPEQGVEFDVLLISDLKINPVTRPFLAPDLPEAKPGSPTAPAV